MSQIQTRKTVFLPLNQIDVTDRVRQDYPNIEELAKSIENAGGLIHPVVVSLIGDDQYKLVAGGRRYKAHEHLKRSTIEALIIQSLSEAQIALLEAEENFQREDFHWTERILSIAKVHKLSTQTAWINGQQWSQQNTGRAIGVSQATVSSALKLVPYILNKDKEILECDSALKAFQLLIQRTEDEAKRQLAKTQLSSNSLMDMRLESTPSSGDANIDKARKASKAVNFVPTKLDVDLDSLFDSANAGSKPFIDLDEMPSTSKFDPEIDAPANKQKVVVPLDNMFITGDAVVMMKQMPAESFDHIFTDPPYGIDMKNLIGNMVERTAAEHDVDANVSLLEAIIPQLYRVLKPNGFCFLWYDVDHHEKIGAWAKAAGFSVQRWPFIWHKTNRCQNTQPLYNTTKDYETCYIFRKGGSFPLPVDSSLYSCSNITEEKVLAAHPFFKPIPVWLHLMKMVGLRGQTILDPFAGGGSAILAAIEFGFKPMAIELKQEHVDSAKFMVRQHFTRLFGNEVSFQ